MAKLANFLEGTAYGVLNDLLGYLNSDDGYATPNRFEVVLPTPAPSPVISGGGLFRGAANGVAGNTTRIANNKFMIVEVDPGNGIANKFYTVRVANATSATAANLENKWTFGTVSAANVYFANSFVVVGSGTAFNTQFANGDTMIIGTDGRKFHPVRLNKVINATRANTSTLWTDSNISSANVFYYTGV